MNKTGYGNYVKLIAFFLVAALLVVGFGFATEGWWQVSTPPKEDGINTNLNDITDNGNFGTPSDSPTIADPVPTPPEFTNYLTGMETTEELSRKRHFAFLLDPLSPLYGFYNSDIITEIPIESGETRLLALTNDLTQLSKLGSLSPTRAYISNVAKFFGAVIVTNGNDGIINYESCDMSGAIFDMLKNPGHCYTEYSQFTYTNADLLQAGMIGANINTSVSQDTSIPYSFSEFGKALHRNGFSAKSVIIPHSQKSETELYYSTDTNSYSFNKNGAPKKDILSDKKIEFKNVFILFTDTLTYEYKDSTEMVMETVGKGSGIYISDGIGQNITWESDISGNMTFYNASGEKLTVNRGTSYIGYAKSSRSNEIKIS